MAMVIKPKRKFTAGAPTTSDIVEGEIAINTADKKLYVRDNSNAIIEIGGAAGTTAEITQNSHGFVVKDAIYHNGSAWAKAQANSVNSLALGIVTEKTTNTFVVAQSGRFTISSHSLIVGQWYYLSASSAGGLVTTEPVISQPIVYVEDANTIQIFQYRPTNLLVNGSSSIIPGNNTVTSAKIVDGTIVAADLATNAITTAKITDLNVTTGKIANDAITAAKIDNDAVGAAAIADDAVGADAIADNSVDIARLNVTDGSNGQFLKTNGSGTLSFASITPDSGRPYTDWAIKTGTYTAVDKDQLIANSGSAFTITLPAGSAGNTVIICNAGAGTVTIGRNGSQKINSAAEDGTLPQGNSVQLVYVSDPIGWFEI
tara:strand:- start:669 stop:1787 length:1119 start_codon:yes stop_codon:yes gene_type:complete